MMNATDDEIQIGLQHWGHERRHREAQVASATERLRYWVRRARKNGMSLRTIAKLADVTDVTVLNWTRDVPKGESRA